MFVSLLELQLPAGDPLALSAHVQQTSDVSLQINAPQTHGGSPFPPQQCPTGACIGSLATNAGPLHGSFSLADPNATFAIVNGIQATCSDGTQLDLQAVLPAAHYTQNWTATYNASQITAPEGCCFPGEHGLWQCWPYCPEMGSLAAQPAHA